MKLLVKISQLTQRIDVASAKFFNKTEALYTRIHEPFVKSWKYRLGLVVATYAIIFSLFIFALNNFYPDFFLIYWTSLYIHQFYIYVKYGSYKKYLKLLTKRKKVIQSNKLRRIMKVSIYIIWIAIFATAFAISADHDLFYSTKNLPSVILIFIATFLLNPAVNYLDRGHKINRINF